MNTKMAQKITLGFALTVGSIQGLLPAAAHSDNARYAGIRLHQFSHLHKVRGRRSVMRLDAAAATAALLYKAKCGHRRRDRSRGAHAGQHALHAGQRYWRPGGAGTNAM